MQHFRVVWLKRSVHELAYQIMRIAENNPTAARNQRNRIVAKVTQLVNFPACGRAGVIEGTRELVASPWVIVYRIKGRRVEILRILHGKQKRP